MRELLLLWLFASGLLFLLSIMAVLAVGVVFGVLKLIWKSCLFAAGALDRLLTGQPPKGGSDVVEQAAERGHTQVPGRVPPAGGQPLVRMQAGLVPSTARVTQCDLGGVEQRGPGRARDRDVRGDHLVRQEPASGTGAKAG